MENKTPEQIEWAAAEAGLSMAEVCRASKVAASTIYRAKQTGRPLRPLTVAKLLKTIKAAGAV